MSEKRFTLRTNSVSTNYPSGRIFDNKKQHSLYLDEVVFVLNEQQFTITELERKLKKFEKIGEEQLKQIIELQDELNECRARPTLATDERGVVKVEYR